MRFSQPQASFLLLLLATTCIAAQTPNSRARTRRPRPTTPISRPAATPSTSPTAATVTPRPTVPISLAVVNGQTVTSADIDPNVRYELEGLDEKIADARRQVLEMEINTILLAFEARRRKLTTHQLYDVEVAKRIKEPTASEIDKFIAENRAQLNATDGPELRAKVAGFLRGNREEELSEQLVRRLRTTIPVVPGVDINTPNLISSSVVATIAGQPLTAGFLNERLKPLTYRIRLAAYEVAREAAERTIDDLLLVAEANRQNIGPEEIVRREVSERAHAPTEAEVAKYYEENKERITGNLDVVRSQLASYLADENQKRLERALSESLRKGANIRWLISEPEAPRLAISTDDDPSRGDPKAAVTVVEFTDFQCPACAAMHPVLEEVLKSYGNQVRLVVRDFPLDRHPDARKAAEAANAAHAQGKFFEYTALLFKRQNALDVTSLKKYASELGMKRAPFDAALDSGVYAAEVRKDMQDGESYGVDSTPTIFVNGVRLNAMSADTLREAIDRALAEAASSKRPARQ